MSGPDRGYVTDIPYTRHFYRELAPAWLDFTATLSGISPPVRGDDFSWCEIGCGQGVSTVALAATHPQARFVGIDLMQDHIEHARRLAEEAGVTNAIFYAADLADSGLVLPDFDYIVAHGVYSWVSPAVQAALRQFIDCHLRPGGLVYLSYNAMPGRGPDLPFQRLMLALAADLPGDSGTRFLEAARTVRSLIAAGAPSLAASQIAADVDGVLQHQPAAYLAHEYLCPYWQPLFVTEMRAAMAEIGIVPAGSAVLVDNFDSFALRRAERDVLSTVDDAGLRELCRDFLTDKRFRRDVFSRDGGSLDDDERRERLLAMRYALIRPAEAVEYSTRTSAGRLSFDNPTAHAIVTALDAGPRIGFDLVPPGVEAQDTVASVIALCCGDAIRPVAAADTDVSRINAAIRSRLGGPDEINCLALSCGTAIRVEQTVLRGGANAAENAPPLSDNCRRFLTVHGAAAGPKPFSLDARATKLRELLG